MNSARRTFPLVVLNRPSGNLAVALRLLSAMTALLLLLGACSNPSRLAAVPEHLAGQAALPEFKDIRYWSESGPDLLKQEALRGMARERRHLESIGHSGKPPDLNFLAISGGGDNGAFAAGLLSGWTETGTRPEFKVVTGVSTGALAAPFAFLGPEYDDRLKEVFTTISADDIYNLRSPMAAIFDDAMADNEPLRRLVEHYADATMLQAIGREYEKGRTLLVATTNLDAQEPVIWNIGKIAASGHPKSLRLFQDILIASSAVPGALPPIMIDVEIDGQRYQEMHVDGGTMTQIFLYPAALNVGELTKVATPNRKQTLYLIRNGRIDPDWDSIERRTVDILSRALLSLIQAQGTGDLYRVYLITQRDGIDYKLAFIGRDFEAKHEAEFDTEFMQELFDYGYAQAKRGYPWQNAPPDFVEAE